MDCLTAVKEAGPRCGERPQTRPRKLILGEGKPGSPGAGPRPRGAWPSCALAKRVYAAQSLTSGGACLRRCCCPRVRGSWERPAEITADSLRVLPASGNPRGAACDVRGAGSQNEAAGRRYLVTPTADVLSDEVTVMSAHLSVPPAYGSLGFRLEQSRPFLSPDMEPR